MAGELVPLVLIPRYSCYSGADSYVTIGMDVTPYQNAIVNVWRNAVIGTAGDPDFNLEESSDQVTWSTCAGTTADFTPSAGTETQYTAQLKKRWFRIRIDLANADNVMTCYAVGFLEERET
jgi:hypothetical protein